MQRVSSFLPSWDKRSSGSRQGLFGWSSNRSSTSISVANANSLTRINTAAANANGRVHREAFWPATLDRECEKAARILKSFCTDGYLVPLEEEEDESRSTTSEPLSPKRVTKKIPRRIIQNAAGIAIFTCMRSGLWMTGSGGSGILIARKSDGTWSPPSGIMLHTPTLSFIIGVDVYDCVLVVNNLAALESITKPRVTLGEDVGLTSGPLVSLDSDESHIRWKDLGNTVLTYMKSRGQTQAVNLNGCILAERGNENERFYASTLTQMDILAGNVARNVDETRPLFEIIKMAEGRTDYDAAITSKIAIECAPGDAVIASPKSSTPASPRTPFGIPSADDPDPFGVLALEMAGLEIREAGSRLRPTSSQFDFNPVPTSPAFSKFNRQSVDTFVTRSNRGSYMSSRTVKSQMTDAGTQTDVGKDTPETTPSPGQSEDGHDRASRAQIPDVTEEEEEIDYTKVDLTPIRHLSGNHTPASATSHSSTTAVEHDTLKVEPRDDTDKASSKYDSDRDDRSSRNADDENDSESDAEEEEDDEEEPVVFEVAAVQPARTQAVASRVIHAKGNMVTIPKRIPPPLPMRSPARTSRPIQTPSSSSAEAHDGRAPRQFGTSNDREDSFDRDSEDYGRERYNPANMASWSGTPSIKGNTEAVRMVLLNFITIGVTFTWGVEMTYCTPYLLNLGLSKSSTSLVWIAGPLSGLVVQPVVGVIADESKSRWGRRRPLMVIGSIIVAINLLVLGFTREIVGWVVKDDEAAKRPTIVLAVLAIYVVDFAINAVMSCAKSLVVDTLPLDKQQSGAAWSSRMSAIGHMIAYGAGAVDLVQIFGTTLGSTQFKQLTVISTVSILGSTALTCWAVTERILISSKPTQHQGRFKVFRQIYSTLLNLPPRIQSICWAQFWAWIGWFPFLFYSTTWVGETYFRYDVPADARKSEDTLGAIGRIGSTALVIYSIITFLGAWVLPMFVQSPEDNSYTHRPPQAIAGFLTRFNKVKPSLLTAWMIGHLMFAGAMSLAPFATSFRFATALVCLCGIPWTLAMWAPSAFLGVEVNKLSGGAGADGTYRRISDEPDIELPELDSDEAPLRLEHGPGDSPPTASTGELSGIYFGILNIYTTLPQFVGTFISTIVFSILEPGKSPELAGDSREPSDPTGPNAIAVCLFIGAMSSLVAAHVTRKLKDL